MSTLFVVATPLGNLADMAERAKATLAGAAAILCEDTRVTRKLLAALNVTGPRLIAAHQHSGEKLAARAADLLVSGQDLALVTDAGTPAISDPGGRLVASLLERLPSLKIVPIPGSTAATTLLSVAGLPADRFLFLGFPPAKKGRAKFFGRAAESPDTVVFYESPHRLDRTLNELRERLLAVDPANANRRVVIGRELTKMFETIYRGTVANAATLVPEKEQRGEFTIAVGGQHSVLSI